jgi:hypothetical protein
LTNPLKAARTEFVGKLTAADFASIAREDGKGELAKKWQEVADQRGEGRVPDHLRVSFHRETKEKIYVPRAR